MMSFFRWLRDICKQDDFVNDPAPYDAMVLTRCRDEDVFVNDPTPYDAQIFEGEPGYVPPVREELFPEYEESFPEDDELDRDPFGYASMAKDHEEMELMMSADCKNNCIRNSLFPNI